MNLSEESQREQDAQVIERLLREQSGQLERIAWSILRDWSLAADAVQEAFAVLAQKLAEVPPEQRGGWLVKTVQFQAHNLRRKQQRATQLPEKLLASGLIRDADESQPGELLLDRAEQLQQMRAAIDGLPEAQRAVVLGRLRDEKTFAQLAAELQLPLGTVLSRMRLALDKLRTKLDER